MIDFCLTFRIWINHNTHACAPNKQVIGCVGRDEIVRGIQHLAQGIQQGLLDIPDIHEELLDYVLDTRHTSPCDLVIRTSGEVRLSDFILWQVDISSLHFSMYCVSKRHLFQHMKVS